MSWSTEASVTKSTMIPQNTDNADMGSWIQKCHQVTKRKGTTIERCIVLSSDQQLDWAMTLYMCKEKPTRKLHMIRPHGFSLKLPMFVNQHTLKLKEAILLQRDKQ